MLKTNMLFVGCCDRHQLDQTSTKLRPNFDTPSVEVWSKCGRSLVEVWSKFGRSFDTWGVEVWSKFRPNFDTHIVKHILLCFKELVYVIQQNQLVCCSTTLQTTS